MQSIYLSIYLSIYGAVTKYLNIVVESETFISIRFRCNLLSLVIKIFVSSGRTSKAQNISTLKHITSKKLMCRMDNY